MGAERSGGPRRCEEVFSIEEGMRVKGTSTTWSRANRSVTSLFTIPSTSTYVNVDVVNVRATTTTTSGDVRSANDLRTTLHAATRVFVVSTRRHGR
jgi:hypothetical protein